MGNLDRLYNIAKTGQIPATSPVDSIMAQYKPQEEQGSLWNGVKNFAGSNGGRMLLGGLAGTALGALGSRNLDDALSGGIMGAMGAAKGITMRNAYNDNILQQQQERADRIAQRQEDRNFQREMQQTALASQKEAAELAFNRRLQELAANRDFQREMAAENHKYALEDRQSNYDFQTKLADDAFNRYLLESAENRNFQREMAELRQDFTREGWKNTADREDLIWQRNLDADIARENRENALYDARLADERAYNNQIWQRNHEADIAKENRINNLYDTRLADERAYNAGLLADERAYNADLLADERAYQKDIKADEYAQQFNLENAKSRMRAQEYIDKLEYERQKAAQKAEMESSRAEQQNSLMFPKLKQSIERARTALKEGTGLGQFGGWGWTTGQGGQNRADIQTAQVQINMMMRGMLKEMGVGSTELNSATESAAYRYQIRPDMPIDQIARILDNFERDYMNGDLQKVIAATASQYGGHGTIPTTDGFAGNQPKDYKIMSDDELLNF